jgi:hypothetical protein
MAQKLTEFWKYYSPLGNRRRLFEALATFSHADFFYYKKFPRAVDARGIHFFS